MQNLYKVNENTITPSEGPGYIKAGIHENIKLVEVKCDESVNGNPFLSFQFEDEQGNKLFKTEWEPKQMGEWTIEDKIKNQLGVLKQIVDIYKPGIETIEATSFKDYVNKLVLFLGDSYKNKLVRIKSVYDFKGFTTVPNIAKYYFIESMDVPKEESKIEILPNDRMERPKREVEKKEENPLDIEEVSPQTSGSSGQTDYTPF